MTFHDLFRSFTPERVGWFGAGLSAAALGVVGYQFVLASFLTGALPGAQPAPSPTPTATATRTPVATRAPTRTPTPIPPDLVATVVLAEPDAIVRAVATFSARTADAVRTMQATPRPA